MSERVLSSKRVFLILCHPDKNSLTHALAKQIRESFEAKGSVVQTSDLHAMGWSPISDRSNFKTVASDSYYQQASEERKALSEKAFSNEITHEMEKLRWCDTLIFQTPLHWYGLPAMIKSWVDKVFNTPFAYGGGRWYNVGNFRDKRAFLSVTTGANDKMYELDGIQGSIDRILFPINHGIFFFCGFHPLKSFIIHSAGAVKRERFDAEKKRLDEYIKNIDEIPEIDFLSLEQTADATGNAVPREAQDMICLSNKLMKAWAKNDRETYKALISHDFRMVIPAYGIDVTGFEAVWKIRESMGSAPLNPHTCDMHTFTSDCEVQCHAHVISLQTGKQIQLSECYFRFDEQSFHKCKEYRQENLFMAPRDESSSTISTTATSSTTSDSQIQNNQTAKNLDEAKSKSGGSATTNP